MMYFLKNISYMYIFVNFLRVLNFYLYLWIVVGFFFIFLKGIKLVFFLNIGFLKYLIKFWILYKMFILLFNNLVVLIKYFLISFFI